MNNRNVTPQYDFSEFAPNNVPNQNTEYDFSEFAPNPENQNIINNVPREKNLLGAIMSGEVFNPENKNYMPVVHNAAKNAFSALELANPAISIPLRIAKAAPIIAKDIGNTLGSAAGIVLNHGAPAIGQLFEKNNFRPFRAAGAGLAEQGQGLLNIIQDTPEYLAHLGQISPETAKKITPYLPGIGDNTEAINQTFGLTENQAGDEFWRGLFRNSLAIAPAKSIIGKGAVTGAKSAWNMGKTAIGKTDPIAIAEGLNIQNNINKLEQKVPALEKLKQDKELLAQQAVDEHFANNQAYDLAKDTAKTNINVGKNTPSSIELELNKKNKEFADIQAENNRLKQELEGIKPLEPFKNEDISHIEKMANATNEVLNAEKRIGAVETNFSNANNLLTKHDIDTAKHFNVGDVHDVKQAARINVLEQKIREDVGKDFDVIEQNLKGIPIEISHEKAIKNKTEQLTNYIKENKLHTNEKDILKLQAEIDKLKDASGPIPADAYLRLFRSAKNSAYTARKKAYKPNMDAEERHIYQQRFNGLDQKVSEMGKVLESAIGPENSALLQSANAIWRDKIKPLERNNNFQAMRYLGRLEGNTMHKVRGTEKGNIVLREMIKSDPELLKSVIDQRFEQKPESIYKPTGLTREYLNLHPESQRIIERRNNLQQEVATATKHLESAKQSHAKAKEQEKKAHEYGTAIDKEISEFSKEHQAKIKTQESLIKKHKTQIQKNESRIKKIEEKKPDLIKHMKELRESEKNTKLSLDKKIKLENEYKSASKDLDNLEKELVRERKKLEFNNDKLSESTTGLRKAFLAAKIMYKAARKIYRIGG